MLLGLLIASCSSKTEALANKSLMSRPPLHSSSASQQQPNQPPAEPAH
jgi:hypothetical protein